MSVLTVRDGVTVFRNVQSFTHSAKKKEFAKNKFGPKFDFGFFGFSFFNAESKNLFSVFGLK